jgi:hypothetical protein
MESASTPPHRGPATQAETGRACPYCRFPLKEGVDMVQCGVCAAPHHADCWTDNGGCAVVACAGGPEAATGAPTAVHAATPPPPHAAPPPAAAAAPASPPPGAPAWAPQPAAAPALGAARTGPWVVAAAIVLALVVAGSALAVVLSQNSDAPAPTTQTVVTVQQPAAPSEQPEDFSTDGDEGATDSENVAPKSDPYEAEKQFDDDPLSASNPDTRRRIRQVLYEHHDDIVSGDYAGAWDLMSERKQRQKLREDGYGAWEAAQRTLTPYLAPSGIRVRVDDVDRNTGVARVMVTGMGWSKPGAGCAEWSGITWVKYENGGWYYDPGYSTTPQRERDWKNRFGELLGGSC